MTTDGKRFSLYHLASPALGFVTLPILDNPDSGGVTCRLQAVVERNSSYMYMSRRSISAIEVKR